MWYDASDQQIQLSAFSESGASGEPPGDEQGSPPGRTGGHVYTCRQISAIHQHPSAVHCKPKQLPRCDTSSVPTAEPSAFRGKM